MYLDFPPPSPFLRFVSFNFPATTTISSLYPDTLVPIRGDKDKSRDTLFCMVGMYEMRMHFYHTTVIQTYKHNHRGSQASSVRRRELRTGMGTKLLYFLSLSSKNEYPSCIFLPLHLFSFKNILFLYHDLPSLESKEASKSREGERFMITEAST